jgi:hypothetical protein
MHLYVLFFSCFGHKVKILQKDILIMKSLTVLQMVLVVVEDDVYR